MSKTSYSLHRGSDAALTLFFAKVNKGTITTDHLRFMNHKRFSNAPNVRRMLNALTAYGLYRTNEDNNEWRLTSEGLDCVYKLVESSVRLHRG
jgi:hypothetical protein